MNVSERKLYAGTSTLTFHRGEVNGKYVAIGGEEYYCIRNYDQMQPFFMSLVSSSDHWMFISSTGGLTAGRANAESTLFPYYTDDRVTENYTNTGPVSVLRVTRGEVTSLWEPFSARYSGLYRTERNLYKNIYGNKLIFEEINHDLGLTYRYAWRSSEKYGFVKTAWLKNNPNAACSVSLLDGLQNLLPYGATTALQTTFSNLLNAYKRNELEPESGLGMFTLSSTLTDLAEPSESLKATTVWQVGLENPQYLLSAQQLEDFRCGSEVSQEMDIRGFRGAYLVHANLEFVGSAEKEWSLVAEVNQDGSQVAASIQALKTNPQELHADLNQDIEKSSSDLQKIVAQADGLQVSADELSTAHHFANVLFNTMRGGIFAENYTVGRDDLLDFLNLRNRTVLQKQAYFFVNLPEKVSYDELLKLAVSTGSADLERLCYEYLPLTFSRRHGDPSRPWNKFSINVKKPDGSQRLDYQGNWRDIFQNWEPLAWSYPEFVEGMICKFLNATTADGYNPYRVTREGIDWEAPAPHDPWANIGYWGDHQIVYLEKLLEISHKFHPGLLRELLTRRIFSHANVPYRIKPYLALLEDAYNTIEFDWEQEKRIEAEVKEIGTDAKLLRDIQGQVFHVNLVEKLLTLLLAKLVNFVPEGGIWMNTQRPEWNDANNALVGKGLSVVTLGYLRRLIVFFEQILAEGNAAALNVTRELADFFTATQAILTENIARLETSFNDAQRRQLMDSLGQTGSAYRTNYYENGFSGEFTSLDQEAILGFLGIARKYVEHSLKANRRPDNLYHAYNVLHFAEGKASIGHLDEMLEGQVSILSSGLLPSTEALALLHSLRNSRLYRADQHSYILYPNRDLPGFLRKNCLDENQVAGSALIAKLVEQNNQTLISKDINGTYHFNGSFKSARDVKNALTDLRKSADYRELVEAESAKILDLFERHFNHQAFTGRSGTFFAYEGLGSIYWHMVSKLLLATQEIYFRAALTPNPSATGRGARVRDELAAAYADIRRGLGYHKSPEVYGAFPTDPYSHTPAGQGAKQPGMTGQVKEEILTRLGELGLFVENGVIRFNPILLQATEFTTEPDAFSYIDVTGQEKTIELLFGSVAFTFCQVPVILYSDTEEKLLIQYTNGSLEEIPGSLLTAEISQHIFERDNRIEQILYHVKKGDSHL
jgi:hypothetical protein